MSKVKDNKGRVINIGDKVKFVYKTLYMGGYDYNKTYIVIDITDEDQPYPRINTRELDGTRENGWCAVYFQLTKERKSHLPGWW